MVLGGFLIRWTGWRYGMMVDASCHYVASLLALGIAAGTAPGPATGRAGSAAGPLGPAVAAAAGRFFRELGEVIGLVFRNRTVAFVLASIGVTSFVSAGAYTVLLRLIQQDLGLGTAGIGVFTGILAVGMVGGAAVIGFFPRLDRVRIVVAVLLLYGVLFVLGPWFMTIWFLALVAVLAGVAFSWLGVVQTAMLQESVAPEVRGRIFSSREFITNAVFLVTTLILGAVGDLVPLRTVLRGIGAALIVTGIAGLLWTRSIGRQDRA
jgi:hypothetical protein